MTTTTRMLRTPNHVLRQRMEAAVERMIAFLEAIDALDEDLEGDDPEDGDRQRDR